MAEWLYEEGIGENRAALVEDDRILEAHIEFPGQHHAGAIVRGRLTSILVPGRRGVVRLADGAEALIEPLPARVTEGAAVQVEIVREPIAEKGRPKIAKGRISAAPEKAGETLLQRLEKSGLRVSRLLPSGPDRLEDAGWSELLEEAASGHIPFEGGALRMSVTPAMTLFDVDGALPLPQLAIAGAAAAARAIRRLGVQGSIGIDLPTLSARDERQAAAKAVDELLPQPFERTAVNGFGFLQIVRRRDRASIPELVQGDPAGAGARLLLRKAERLGGGREIVIQGAPGVIARLQATPDWLDLLARRTGARPILSADPGASPLHGHAQLR